MNKFVVVVFPDETKAYQGLRAFQELHEEGIVSAYGTEVVKREANGALSIKQQSDRGPLGGAVGALVGGLIGMFGGPAGAVIGMVGGGVAGGWRDFLHAEVSDEFLEAVQRELVPGTFALVADVTEDWVGPVDLRMEALGGKVVREVRQDFVEDLIKKRVDVHRAELAERMAEHADAKAERMESKLMAEIEHAAEKLQRTAEKAKERLDHTKEELEAKLHALEDQAAKAKPEVKSRIEQRIAELRKEFGEREKKLRRAYELSQEATQP